MKCEPPQRLLDGYRQFRRERFPVEAARFRELAHGQAPKTMVIACADSRVDPSTIFAAAPGELFVVRNVANLVPPIEENGSYHGTSAALEFAVTQLKIDDIVVLGHGMCGGIAAALAAVENRSMGRFLKPWVELLSPAREEVRKDSTLSSPASRQRALEHLAIRHSLKNLQSFPFISGAIENGTLALHGAWFSIAEGELHWLNQASKLFYPIVSDSEGSAVIPLG